VFPTESTPEEDSLSAPALLHDVLDGAAAQHPDALGVRHGAQARTYRWIQEESLRLAAALTALEVRRGDRVLIALPPGILMPPLLFGCSRIGAVFIVLGPDTPAPVAAHVLDDAMPSLVITTAQHLRGLADARGIRAVDAPALSSGVALPSHAVVAVAGPLAVDPVCFIYTSGSTAMPKAVVCTHLQVTFVAAAIHSRLRYRCDDTVFCALPLSFDYGLYQIFLCTLAGAQLYLADSQEAGHRLLLNLQDSGATVIAAVPSLTANLERLLARRPTGLPRLRLLTNTGAAMPAGLLAALRSQLPGLRIQLMYGLTECKRAAIMPVDADLSHPGACGQALPGTEIYAVDESGARLPAGAVGELVVRGPHVMAGYWRQPALSAERFRYEHGLFPQLHTGDYGWLDDEGFLFFAGRRDDMYKQGGFRVSTIEVEAAAHRVPGVRAAVVVPPSAGVAEAVLLVQGSLTAEEVLRLLRREIDEVKVPTRCMVVDRFPLNANGKVERRRLGELVKDGSHG
jgi:acyl-CoA synthetase (AMP-forming)/AMP-acid ligase II